MINIPNLILASKSQIRAKLLLGAGVEFTAIASNVDEETAKIGMREQGLSPATQAHELAKIKAQKISAGNNNIVIGCDQILNFGGIAYDKANNLEQAKQRLKSFRGKTHSLENAVVIMQNGRLIWRSDKSANLTMHNFSDEFLDNYISRAMPSILHSVGCYELEGLGAQLFSKIEGDYFAILGLPLIELLAFLRQYKSSNL